MSYPDRLPAWAVERKRSRQYVIGKRRSRQRLAQMLGGGVPLARAAAVERRGEAEVELLLADEGFAALVEHYRRFAELPEAEAVAELRRLARDLLHLALRAGDVRAAVFFAYEELRGRDPATVLARAAIHKARRTAEAPTPPPERRLPPRKPLTIRRETDFAYCAATQPSEAEAAALAAAEAARLPARVAAHGRKLTNAILAEAERQGTAEADPLTQSSEAFARKAHVEGGRAVEAAALWQTQREAFAAGQVGEADSGRATLAGGRSDTAPADAPAAPLGFSSPWPGQAQPSSPTPAHGRHLQKAAAGTAAPFSRDGPAPPTLPDWLDQVPGANRAQLLAMKPEERAVTLRTIARFYGFDTS